MSQPELYICHYGDGEDPFLASGLEGIKEALTDLYGGEYRGYYTTATGSIAVDWCADYEGDFVVHCAKVDRIYGQEIKHKSRAA